MLLSRVHLKAVNIGLGGVVGDTGAEPAPGYVCWQTGHCDSRAVGADLELELPRRPAGAALWDVRCAGYAIRAGPQRHRCRVVAIPQDLCADDSRHPRPAGSQLRRQYQVPVLNYDDHWSRTPLQQSANIVRHRNAVLWSVMQMCNSHETVKPPRTCSGALATAAAKLAKWRVSAVADCSTADSTSAGSSSLDSSPSAACRAVYSCSSLHKRTRPVSGQQDRWCPQHAFPYREMLLHTQTMQEQAFSWLQAGSSMSQGPTSASGHHLPRRRRRLPPPAPQLSPTPDRAAAPAALDTPNKHAYEPIVTRDSILIE